MQEWLDECRSLFGNPPRSFGLWERYIYLRFPTPDWCKEKDQINRVLRAREQILREGNVVWGCLIQANNRMFKRGSMDHGGEFVFCPDPSKTVDPAYLAEIARRVFALKGTNQTDHELAWIANYLLNERIRVFGCPVPNSITDGLECEISTIPIRRAHVPGHFLRASTLPLVVLPGKPRLALILPSKYWPGGLKQWWKLRR
jgi:hypothetical protein